MWGKFDYKRILPGNGAVLRALHRVVGEDIRADGPGQRDPGGVLPF